MGLWKKTRNKRSGREHVLDVKLRSDQVRTARVRLLGVAMSLACGTVLALFAIWRGGEWMLNQLLYENSTFAVRRVEVQTDGVISPDAVRLWSRVKKGDNLLALDLLRVKRDLELVPSIQSVSVERVLPDLLRLAVVEREAVAQVLSTQPSGNGYRQAIYHLDASGHVMLPLDVKLRAPGAAVPVEVLPLISGVDPGELRPGRAVENPQVRAALRLIVEFDRSPMAGLVHLERIDTQSPEVLRAVANDGSEVTFGLAGLNGQLRRWRQVLDYSQNFGKAIGSLDLSIANNIPLRLVDTAPVPGTPAKPPKPSRKKKSHV